MRPWKLAETNYGTVKEYQYEVAVLPLGATEPHNLHLPYGMDVFEGKLVVPRSGRYRFAFKTRMKPRLLIAGRLDGLFEPADIVQERLKRRAGLIFGDLYRIWEI